MDAVLPSPEDLRGTSSCELAAMLLTMGFEMVDGLATCRGDGLPGGRRGYFRFLPRCWGKRFDLKKALARGLNPRQPAGTQAIIAAAFHNYRLLIESVQHGTRLALDEYEERYLFRRVEAEAVPQVLRSEADVEVFRAHGSDNTMLVASLATIGFEPYNAGGEERVGIAHGKVMRTWYLPARSRDGRYDLNESMARWQDDAWCANPANDDPRAVCADAFWNLNFVRLGVKNAADYVQVKNGNRTVVVRADAPEAVWRGAQEFLLK